MAVKERSRRDRSVSTGDGSDRAATGIEGLDDILGGGLARGRLHLVQGAPGAGKTTLALQFLLAGSARNERGLLISLSETEEELRATASSHDWSLDSIHIHDVSALEQLASLDFKQSVFQPAAVELTETTRKLLALVEQIKPARVVFDPITELRLLAGDPMRYRRQIFALNQAFASYRSAVLLIEDRVDPERSAASLVHSIIELEQGALGFGRDQHRLRVQKVRAAVHSGKAFMIFRSLRAACACIRPWSPPSIGAASSHIRSRAAFRRSTACSAVAWTKARAPS
jgi:circadian clock protein KaiC